MGLLGGPSTRNSDAEHFGPKSSAPHQSPAAFAAGERTWVRRAFSPSSRTDSSGLSKGQRFRLRSLIPWKKRHWQKGLKWTTKRTNSGDVLQSLLHLQGGQRFRLVVGSLVLLSRLQTQNRFKTLQRSQSTKEKQSTRRKNGTLPEAPRSTSRACTPP